MRDFPRESSLSSFPIGVLVALARNEAIVWGNEGHETVSAIAGRLISRTRAEREGRKLLAPVETRYAVAIWVNCAGIGTGGNDILVSSPNHPCRTGF
jgi:hypothetical protein